MAADRTEGDPPRGPRVPSRRVTVGEVYRALWRHKLFIALLTAGMVGAAWYATSREQRIYEASALVRIQQRVDNPNDVFGALETGGRLAQTYAQIVETTTVARGIASLLHGRVAYRDIVGAVSAHQVQDLDLLDIQARSPDPRVAAAVANAAPRALRSFIRRTATQGDQIITVQPAAVPRSPASPSTTLNLAIALLVGLLVNGLLALLIEAIGDTVNEVEEFEGLAGAPLLGAIPSLELTPQAAGARPRPEERTLDPARLDEVASGG